jgi:hypothetical protein
MVEVVLLVPVMILMWIGIDYFRSGYARRLDALGRSQAAAWKLAYSNDGSCFANKEFFAGFLGDNDPSNIGGMGTDASNTYKSNTSSSMFLYAHANIEATAATHKAHFEGDRAGEVKGSTYIACDEVVPIANSDATQYDDQNVLTPLWDFVSSIF